jgi:hypothetical protein
MESSSKSNVRLLLVALTIFLASCSNSSSITTGLTISDCSSSEKTFDVLITEDSKVHEAFEAFYAEFTLSNLEELDSVVRSSEKEILLVSLYYTDTKEVGVEYGTEEGAGISFDHYLYEDGSQVHLQNDEGGVSPRVTYQNIPENVGDNLAFSFSYVDDATEEVVYSRTINTTVSLEVTSPCDP